MGAENGEPDSALERSPLPERLREEPGEFAFFQAVRLLERITGERLGAFVHPRREPVRLSATASLGFPVSEIGSLAAGEDGPAKMEVNFFGFTGPLGVLPTRYTELLIERVRAGDTSPRDFIDIFNHRYISLLYRAWERYRFPVSYERGNDPFTGYLLHLIGLGTGGLRDRQAVPDQALVCFEGLLAQQPRSSSSFRQLLASYFEIEVEVQPFSGSWRPLDAGSRTCMMDGRSASEQLGVGMVLGDEVWDQQTVVRIRLGPMGIDRYKSFLPDGDAHEPLKAMCRFFCGDDLDVEAQLVLRKEDAPRFALDAEGVPPARLGWVSWMISRPLDRDLDETLLRLWE